MQTANSKQQNLLNLLLNRILIITFILSFSLVKVHAQNQVLNGVNLQLRQFFSPLLKPTPTKKFLYEMSAHSTDSSWYVTNCADTNITDLWYKVYEEMYHAAYDTSVLTTSTTIFNNANNYSNDSIPIGIMNYSYYGLKPDAMSTNTYFNFDTVNNVLSDKIPRPSWPYTDNNTIFMSAPLINVAQSANPVFVISPQFFYFDSENASHFAKNALLKIDFGDGTGWHNFSPTSTSYYQPNYSTTNTVTPVMRVQAVDPSTANIWGGSASRFFPGTTVSVPPDEILDITGLNVGIYNACTNTGKTVIYLEGIDPLDFIPSQNRTRTMIHDTMLRNNRIIELKNQGYRFVVVDWKNSRIDMRFNALYVVNLIQVLKQQSPDNEQFIVIGESMGGVVARFALTYMESPNYARQDISPFFVDATDAASIIYLAANPQITNLPSNWALPEKMHNTRLFISMDAPQQGANVPLSIQKAYKNALGIFGPFVGTVFNTTTTLFNLFLESKATKQLLIEHVSTEAGLGFYKTYSNTPARISFMNQLVAMGSYPQYAKVMLMSNGALDGSNQLNPYTNQLRVANDRLLQFKLDLYAKIFGIKIPVFGGNITARTNPNGSGQILQANAGTFAIRIKLKWFGIKIYADYNSLLNIQEYATTKPYCTSAGSHIGPGVSGLIGTQAGSNGFNLSNNYWALNLFSANVTVDGQGCVNYNQHIGFNGFLSTNIDMSLCTDGFRFGFIPTYSALDYTTRRGALNTNIEATPIAVKLANIPARVDMIVGVPRGLYTTGPPSFTPISNLNHLRFRNDDIFNLTGVAAIFPNPSNTYFACTNNLPSNVPRVRRGFLNLEIGDEELFLENNSLQYNAQYKVEYDLHLNERNPRYEYISQPYILNSGMLAGIYSKQDAFSISPSGFATFIYDATTTPRPPGHIGFYGTTTGSFTQLDQPLNNCCLRYSTLDRGGNNTYNLPVSKSIPSNKNKYLQIFPNPNSGNKITLKYKFNSIGKVLINIINMQGVTVFDKALFIPNSKLEITSGITISDLQLPNGVYILKLTNGNETLSSKLVIAK
jgi:hypothetical protein